jgi:hypothetical protein
MGNPGRSSKTSFDAPRSWFYFNARCCSDLRLSKGRSPTGSINSSEPACGEPPCFEEQVKPGIQSIPDNRTRPVIIPLNHSKYGCYAQDVPVAMQRPKSSCLSVTEKVQIPLPKTSPRSCQELYSSIRTKWQRLIEKLKSAKASLIQEQ